MIQAFVGICNHLEIKKTEIYRKKICRKKKYYYNILSLVYGLISLFTDYVPTLLLESLDSAKLALRIIKPKVNNLLLILLLNYIILK